jgi:hypothetical protein
MPSKTAQRRIGRPGALLAVMMGAGWSCAQLVGADFDKPLQTDGAGGTGGGMPSTSSGGTGGAMSSASSSAMSSTSSSGSSSATGSSGSGVCIPQGTKDTVCGPMGEDGDCDGVRGDCDTQRIYVGVRTKNDSTACGDLADDIFMSESRKTVEDADFQVISEFKTFKTKLAGTTELNRCTDGGGPNKDNKATISNLDPCKPGSDDFRPLGFVSTVQAEGYEELKQMGIGPNTGILLDNSTYDKGCCHASSNTQCAPLSTPVYVPKD